MFKEAILQRTTKLDKESKFWDVTLLDKSGFIEQNKIGFNKHTKNKLIKDTIKQLIKDKKDFENQDLHKKYIQESAIKKLKEHSVHPNGNSIIWGGEDHKPSRIVGYCPLHILEMLNSTFELQKPLNQCKIFRPVKIDPRHAGTFVDKAFRRKHPKIVKRHKWAFKNTHENLPKITILFKRKKLFELARPVIRYVFCCLVKLYKATARALIDIFSEVIQIISPGLNMDITRRIMEFCTTWTTLIADFVSENNYDQKLWDLFTTIFDNEDLEGFFPSVPQDRMNSGTALILEIYRLTSCRKFKNENHENWSNHRRQISLAKNRNSN